MNTPVVLTSWKEIAAYLNKGVRTVQRWENELGLPVRRPRVLDKQTVMAVPRELDEWVNKQTGTRNLKAPDSIRVSQELRAQLETTILRTLEETRLLLRQVAR